MNGTIEFLTTYGYGAIFTCVLVEQIGVPLPATPVLIAAGALAGLAEPLGGLATRGRGVIDWRFHLVLPRQNARNVGSPFALQNLIGT